MNNRKLNNLKIANANTIIKGFSNLTLSWRRSLSYRNQSIYLLHKSVHWFLYGNSLRHERVKSKLEKMFVQYSASGRPVSKFTFWLNWPLLFTNLTFNLKIFEDFLSHLHGNYKHDIYNERDSNLAKSVA